MHQRYRNAADQRRYATQMARHALETAPRIVRVKVRYHGKCSRTEFDYNHRVPPRKNPNSNVVRIEAVKAAFLYARGVVSWTTGVDAEKIELRLFSLEEYNVVR